MVQLGMYDAVNAIDGGGAPYLAGLPDAPATASKAAAAATAAHDILVGLVPALPQPVRDHLATRYTASMASIADGSAKIAGIEIGAAVADALLAARANDGRYGSFRFSTGSGAGVWRPDLPLNVNDPFGWVARVEPFSISSVSSYLTEGPLSLTSAAYTKEFNEVKALGSPDGISSRTPEQTYLARFVTANPVVMLNRGLRELADARDLSITDAARLFAMSSTSAADSIIACWASKEHWGFWRPITAIRNAGSDGNPATVAQVDWEPFFGTPPYPDHPSGYNCYTAGMLQAARAFFGTDKVGIALMSPSTGTTERYDRLSDVIDDTIDGRVYTGFHFRTADVQGAWIGKKVAQWVAGNEFVSN